MDFVRVKCDCGKIHVKRARKLLTNWASCQGCKLLHDIPDWLYYRCCQQRDRCENTKNPGYANYGGRGIRFLFKSPREAAIWVAQNLGIHRTMHLDRINNDGNYEPGNLRYSTPPTNAQHTRISKWTKRRWDLREQYPECGYRITALRDLFHAGLSNQEIAERWAKNKRLGRPGFTTYVTPEKEAALLFEAQSPTTV
jgi:hypothetical protein